jgi:alpha-D-xyloside xylohydrolase
MGVDVFKSDFGEDIPADAVFHDGRTGATMHNLYPVLYNRAVFEVTQEEKGYGLVWGRSSFASSQKYPVVWSGDPASDFASLATTVRGGLAAGQSGLPFWSNDIGGYRGKPPAELFARWAQFGLFCSHSRLHGDSPREPWHFGDEAVAVFRKYANLRYELFPYIYSAAWEASLKGLPVIRALPLAFPEDRGACGQDFEFMFGPSILVAPVIQAGGKVNVYLPEGTWFDYWTSRAYEGPRHHSLEVPLDILPIFVRGGAIIPRMSRQWRIPEEKIDPLIVEVWPRGSSSHLFYEDEGVTEFRSDQKRQTLELAWSGPTSRRLIFHLKRIPKPKKITLAADEERDKVLKLEGLVLKKTYVLALPETASGQLHLFFR